MGSNGDDHRKLSFVPLMSAVDSLLHPPVIPQRPRHESPVVIDVDAFDADDIVYVGSAGPSQRRHVEDNEGAVRVTNEVIHLSDSEDDNEVQFIGHNPARPQPPLIRRARIFSPPPAPQIDAIPPVPQVPQRFLRQRAPVGLVIPNEDPFPFEADLRHPSPAEQPYPAAAAAPSHHVPAMGFGGALLAGVRRFMGPRNTPQRPERRNSWGVSGSFIMRWDAFDFAGGEEDALFEGADGIGFLGDENPSAAGGVRNQIERAFRQRGREGRAEPDYQPEYTHPDRPSPGFTHDFSPSSSTSSLTGNDRSASHHASGSRSCEATLICAVCRDPLFLGASDVGVDRAKRKLWGLRCGHLLDGKCVEKLMEPCPPTTEDVGSSSTRRVAAELMEYPPRSSQDAVVVDPDASSMRSRLRPRRGTPGSFSSVRYPAHGAPTRTHRSNRKGKGKMKVPVVEAEHEWYCPVSGCGRVHASLLLDGRWTMDEKRGAIPVFV